MTRAVHERYQSEGRPQTLPARKLGELLSETFAIYGRHFLHLIGLVAMVQVPVSLITMTVTLIQGGGLAVFVASVLLNFFGMALVYAMVAFAVGQHYVIGKIDIRRCYERVWWRIVSLILLCLALAPVFLLFSALLIILVIPAIALVAIPIQSVIIEGHTFSAALQRSFTLARGNWGRVLGIALVYGFVGLGLAILLYLPFLIIAVIAAPTEGSVLTDAVQVLGSVTVSILVPPVLAIAGTLLYYDLRVRKEDYDFTTMGRELGIATS